MNESAEIMEIEDVPFETYNPNKTQQIVNLVKITPTINVGNLPDTRKPKLTKESISSVLKMYNEIASEHGFQAEWDIETIQGNFNSIIDDWQEEVFKVVLSKAFGKFQLAFFQKAMISCMTLVEQISSPEVLNDTSVSIEYKYGMLTQLLNLMNQVSELYEKVKIDNADIVLRSVAQKQSQSDFRAVVTDPKTLLVMEQLKRISLQENSNNDE